MMMGVVSRGNCVRQLRICREFVRISTVYWSASLGPSWAPTARHRGTHSVGLLTNQQCTSKIIWRSDRMTCICAAGGGYIQRASGTEVL